MLPRSPSARRGLQRTRAVGLPAALAAASLIVLLLAQGAPAGEASPTALSAAGEHGPVDLATPSVGRSASSAELTITDFVASPSAVVIGSPTYLNVSVEGGTDPLSVSYSGLPYPCVTSDTLSLLCRPSEVRSFVVIVSVTDANGTHASRSTELDVLNGYLGPPSFASFYARPAVLPAGAISYLWANATSPSEPAFLLALTYFDLPPGCASFNQTPLECLTTAPGNYTIGVRVTDAFGQAALAYSTLVVTGSPGPAVGGGSVPVWAGSAAAGTLVVASAVGTILLLRRRRAGRRDDPR